MMSKGSILIIANIIAINKRDKVVNQIGESLRNSFNGERISEARVQRILDKFVKELKNI